MENRKNELSLRERLEKVLAGRKATPWAKALNISAGALDDMMNKNRRPSAEVSTRILDAENVNLSWLLEGQGSPFLVEHLTGAVESVEWLSLYSTEDWQGLYLYNETSPMDAVCLYTPVEKTDSRGRSYRFIASKLAVGQFFTGSGPRDIGMQACEVTPFVMSQLYAGELGTWALVNPENPDALIHQAKLGPVDLPELMNMNVTADESILLEAWRLLHPQDRNNVLDLIQRLSQSAPMIKNTDGPKLS